MKKTLSITIAVLMLLALSVPVFAANDTAVFVTICDKDGKIALAQEKINVTDADGDGALTITDALFCAHEAKYTGGASAGYATANTAYGLSMTKLWGAENGSGYGYYLNNASAWSLTDTVKNGDYVNAFVYTDTVNFSDTFAFFDKNTADVAKNGELTLTLSAAGYDASFNPITLPVANATISVDGTSTAYKTDAQGKVTIKLSAAGKHVISASSADINLVDPVCTVNVSENALTGDTFMIYAGVTVASAAMACVVVKLKKTYEE
jgi:hypothetical protein